jgi:hypothetical protein
MSESLEGIPCFRCFSVRITRKGLDTHVDPESVDNDSKAAIVLLTHLQTTIFRKMKSPAY